MSLVRDHNLIIDIETTSTGTDTKIIAIGATTLSGKQFYTTVDPHCADNSVRLADEGTMKWWSQASLREAKKEAFSGSTRLRVALQNLRDWISKDIGLNNCKPWGNGSTFDISILEHAYKQVGIIQPWRYYHARDVRTLVALSGFKHKELPFEGLEHHALDDAIHEKGIVIASCQRLNITLE